MRAALLLLAGVAALPAVEFTFGSYGGGPVPIGAGARALGMGGAFSAIADDATAATWNPAGMAQLERPELSFSGGYYRQDIDATGRDANADEWHLDHFGGVLPFYAFGLQQSVGLAWQRQFDLTAAVGFGNSTRVEGALPFTLDSSTEFEREGGYAGWSLSYALAAGDRINLGVGLTLWSDDLTAASSSEGSYRKVDESRYDAGFTQISTDAFSVDEKVTSGASLVIGGQWRVVAPLTAAVVLKPGYDLEIERRSDSRQVVVQEASGTTTVLSDTSESSTDTITTEFPTSVTASIAWHPSDRQILAADLTWTRWSEFTTESRGDRVSAFSDLLDPGDVDDDIALRVGYEHLFILPRWVLAGRCGLLYERLPGIEPVSKVTSRDDITATVEDWYGASIGLTAFRRRISYDVAARLRWGEEVGAGVHAPLSETAEVLDLTVRAGVGVYF